MKRKFLWVGLSFLLVASLVLASCGEAVPGEQEEEEEEVEVLGFPRSETVFADVLTGTVLAPSNFNEWVGWKNRDRGMQQLMAEPLWMDLTIHAAIDNILATAPPEYNEDYTQMTVTLREGVYWSDGVEFTADDVVFTIETVRDNEGLNYHTEMQGVESVYAPDRYTVVVKLTEPNSRFHVYFTDRWMALWPMPKHVFQPVAAEGTEALIAFEYDPPLSLGPYVLHSYDPAGSWTAWEKRDDWERTPTGMLYGEPVPKYVVFREFGEATNLVIAQARHELDCAEISFEALRALLATNPYSHSWYSEFPWLTTWDQCETGLSFNTLLPPFDNSDVRWALALSIDIVSYIASAYDGAAAMIALHLAHLPEAYNKWYYEPMQEWLADFTLDLGNGETYKPYDPDAAYRLVEFVEGRGYELPEGISIEELFGYGWWKYSPDVATTLLENNGFTRDKDENWLLPDGTPWEITIMTAGVPGGAAYQNAVAAVQEWKRFGIDADMEVNPMTSQVCDMGEFEVCTVWPIDGGGGGSHPDQFHAFEAWHSDLVEPVLGELTFSHCSRWSDPRMDLLLDELKTVGWDDTDRIIQLTTEAMKVAIEEMPSIPTYSYPGMVVFDYYYWTGWPSSENPYEHLYFHWPQFKYWTPFLVPTGR